MQALATQTDLVFHESDPPTPAQATAILAPNFWPDGRSTMRSVGADEVARALETLTQRPDAQRIRVYSAQGFVPDGYRYSCSIQFVQLERAAPQSDCWRMSVDMCSAKRPYGRGPLVVVR